MSNEARENTQARRYADAGVKCGKCGATGCRLYRPYGNFYRPLDNLCGPCAGPLSDGTKDQRGWNVPLVLSASGEPLGYLAVPPLEGADWDALPEHDAPK